MIKQKGPPREKTKQTKKQYLDVKKKYTKDLKQREQPYTQRNTNSYPPNMTDLLTSNFSDNANISSKDAVSTTKQSSSLVPTRTIFNSNGNRNSNRNSHNNCNSTNQNVKVRDDSIKETDQSNKKQILLQVRALWVNKNESCFII